MSPKKRTTIQRLRKDGHTEIADQVESWRGRNGNSGWDSWFKSTFPELAVEYDVAQGLTSNAGEGLPTTENENTLEEKETRLSVGNVSAYVDVEVKSIGDTLEFVSKRSAPNSQRLFDVYCFADYRGDSSDGSRGIAVALGIPNNPIIHIKDVNTRKSLSMFWQNLLVRLDETRARLIFGQDHQYSVPAGLLAELGISGPWRNAMAALFCGERFGSHATRGKAGEFAAEFNRVLRKEGKNDYFYSRTKSEIYGIPRLSLRENNSHKYRLVEESRKPRPFPFAQVGDTGSVGGQSIVGIPNILALLNSNEGQSVFAWPFDGADLSGSVRHVLIEVYPSAMRPSGIPQSDLNDAIACVEWCMRKDAVGQLRKHLSSEMIPGYENNEATVRVEGWYLA